MTRRASPAARNPAARNPAARNPAGYLAGYQVLAAHPSGGQDPAAAGSGAAAFTSGTE